MKEWTTYHLEDICKEILSGGDAAKYDCVKAKSTTHKYPVFANAIDEDGLYGYCNDYVVNVPAVTIAARGAGTGYVAYRDTPYTPIVRLISLIPKENVNPLFLYYRLKIANLRGDGSAIPQLTVPMVKKFKVTLPDYKTQNTIANILRSLDVKIQLNKQINDNLEQQAQALYKSWFIDFEPFNNNGLIESEIGLIPKGWKVSELSSVTKQITEKVKDRTDVKVLSPVNTGELVLSEEYFTKQVFSESVSKYIVVKPLQFAYNPARVNIGSLGMNTFSFDGCVSPVYVVFECESNYHHFFDYYRKTEGFKEEVLTRAIGGVRQTLSYKDFSLIKLVYPPHEIVEEFNSIYEKLLDNINRIKSENTKLLDLRDTLLPKLMSGELKINETDC